MPTPMSEVSLFTYSTLISTCEEGQTNMELSACEKGKQPGWALDVFEAMQREGVVPN